MASSSRMCLVVSLFGLLGSSGNLPAAEETTLTFPMQKCRFTLPGPDWTWLDKQPPKVLFIAGNSKGLLIDLNTMAWAQPIRMSDQSPDDIERFIYKPGEIQKRGGRFVTFLGRSCYQLEAIVPDGRTVVTRIFAAHGFIYYLSILGTKEPVEADPEFETTMRGFDFTIPPEPEPKRTDPGTVPALANPTGRKSAVANEVYETGLYLAAWMGGITCLFIVGAILPLAVWWALHKRKDRKR